MIKASIQPLALALIVALVFELAGFLSASWRPATSVCLLVALLGCGAAIATGLATGGGSYKEVESHELAGWATVVVTLVALCWSMLTHDPTKNRWYARGFVLLAVIVSSLAGHIG